MRRRRTALCALLVVGFAVALTALASTQIGVAAVVQEDPGTDRADRPLTPHLAVAQDDNDNETGWPPAQDTADGVLPEGIQATLWADAPNDFVTDEQYADLTGDDRTALHALANGTDVSFREPPESGAIWTREDQQSLPGTDRHESARPAHVEESDLEDSGDGMHDVIEDAHITTFGAHPSTIVHRGADDRVRYVTPDGTARAMVDYRTDIPPDDDGNPPPLGQSGSWTEVDYRVRSHRVNRTWIAHPDLEDGGTVYDGSDANRTPAFAYEGLSSDPGDLRIAAEIEVEYEEERTRYRRQCQPTPAPASSTTAKAAGGSLCTTEVVWGPTVYDHSDSLTVTDQVFDEDRDPTFGADAEGVPTEVYDRQVLLGLATFPNGDRGLAAYQPTPWSSLQLADDGSVSVQTNWRFYTARDQGWRTLYEHDGGSSPDAVTSHGVPVHVHAYPSEHEPFVEGDVGRPTVVDTEGQTHTTPTLHEHAEVPVVERDTYEAVDAVAIRYGDLETDQVTVNGIVRGTTLDVSTAGTREYVVRDASLQATAIDANATHTLIRVSLEDAETGEGIDLSAHASGGALSASGVGSDGTRPGYVEVGDRRVETGADGEATVWVEGHGHVTATYRPGSWLAVNPAYTQAMGETYQSPEGFGVGTVFELVATLIAFLAPVAVAIYAGLKLARLIPGSRGEHA